ncbi:unnamed protein product [Urochloa humidicola]
MLLLQIQPTKYLLAPSVLIRLLAPSRSFSSRTIGLSNPRPPLPHPPVATAPASGAAPCTDALRVASRVACWWSHCRPCCLPLAAPLPLRGCRLLPSKVIGDIFPTFRDLHSHHGFSYYISMMCLNSFHPCTHCSEFSTPASNPDRSD